jgi:hypothetical protein
MLLANHVTKFFIYSRDLRNSKLFGSLRNQQRYGWYRPSTLVILGKGLYELHMATNLDVSTEDKGEGIFLRSNALLKS